MSRRRLGRWMRRGMLALPWLGVACSQVGPGIPTTAPSPPPATPGLMYAPSADESFRPPLAPDSKFRLASAPADHSMPRAMPISLDAVLGIAEENNPQIMVARTKMRAAFSEKELAAARWLPDVYIGVGYFQHDGGIQLQQGQIIDSNTNAMTVGPNISFSYDPRDYAFRQLTAMRKLWQENGELSKITYEQTLDASTTYIDLLAAHTALSISLELQKSLESLHAEAKKAREIQMTANLELEEQRLEQEINTQIQNQRKLQGKINAASARLAYLLGLDMNTVLLPVDTQMVAFHIVDISPPLEALVSQSLANGPGIRELEGILGVIQTGLGQSRTMSRFAPQVDLQVGEGLFGAGVLGGMGYDNRFDLAVQARWNLTELLHGQRKRQVAMDQMNQVAWTQQELRARLTMGVQESRATILSSSSNFNLAEDQIRKAKEMLERVIKLHKITPLEVPYSQVLLAHQAVAKAQLNYVELLQDFDKAELRLMILLGPGMKCPPMPATPVMPATPRQMSPYNEKLPPPSELKIETPSP
ncbi:MAG TPA: TolC family protein [Gemmataceae bacterium]|nr:TolC family protein [Gemmataceae bacterium]